MLTDILEIHFIELPKFRKHKSQPDIQNPLDRWLLFLEDSSEEVLGLIKTQDPAIAKAEEVLDWLSSDEETMRLYELREKTIHDEVTRIKGARQEGKEEGMRQGIQQGKEEGKKEIAKSMLINGMDIQLISQITGLSIEVINQVKKDIKQ